MPTLVLSPAARLRIDYSYSPGRPGRMYMPNGDPGYPDDPPELEVNGIYLETLVDGKWQRSPVDLRCELFSDEAVEAFCLQDVDNRTAAAEDARIEALAEAREHACELEDWNP